MRLCEANSGFSLVCGAFCTCARAYVGARVRTWLVFTHCMLHFQEKNTINIPYCCLGDQRHRSGRPLQQGRRPACSPCCSSLLCWRTFDRYHWQLCHQMATLGLKPTNCYGETLGAESPCRFCKSGGGGEMVQRWKQTRQGGKNVKKDEKTTTLAVCRK